jgi:hypothetical protein
MSTKTASCQELLLDAPRKSTTKTARVNPSRADFHEHFFRKARHRGKSHCPRTSSTRTGRQTKRQRRHRYACLLLLKVSGRYAHKDRNREMYLNSECVVPRSRNVTAIALSYGCDATLQSVFRGCATKSGRGTSNDRRAGPVGSNQGSVRANTRARVQRGRHRKRSQ